MLTIFTIPKAFRGHNGIVQRNAIRSWLELKSSCEVILIGDDAGVSDTARDLAVNHIPYVEKNEFGTPLLSSAFALAQKLASNDLMMYINSDIIVFKQLIETVQRISKPLFLLCGRRWDMNIDYEIDFREEYWADTLLQKVGTDGVLHGLSGMDYFIFRRHSVQMLPFAVGRAGWDSWLIYDMRRKAIPVINASGVITAIHQNHDFSHSKFGEKKRVGGPELAANIKVAGGLSNMMTLRDADWLLTKDGLKRPDFPGRIYSLISLWYPWRVLLAAKRTLQKKS